jgi:hypothetical protein
MVAVYAQAFAPPGRTYPAAGINPHLSCFLRTVQIASDEPDAKRRSRYQLLPAHTLDSLRACHYPFHMDTKKARKCEPVKDKRNDILLKIIDEKVV